MQKSTMLVILVVASSALGAHLFNKKSDTPADTTPAAVVDTTPAGAPAIDGMKESWAITSERAPVPEEPIAAPAANNLVATDVAAVPAVPIVAPPPPDSLDKLVNRKISLREIVDVSDVEMTVNSITAENITSQRQQKFRVSEKCPAADLRSTRWTETVPRFGDYNYTDEVLQGCQRVTSVHLVLEADGSSFIYLGARLHGLDKQQPADDSGELAPLDKVTGFGASAANCTIRGDVGASTAPVKFVTDGREVRTSGKVLDCSLASNGTGRVIFNILE